MAHYFILSSVGGLAMASLLRFRGTWVWVPWTRMCHCSSEPQKSPLYMGTLKA